MHQFEVGVIFGQMKVGDTLLVQAQIPSDFDVLLRLRLLQLLVVVGLQLDERTENVLILITIFVPIIR